MPRVDRTHEIAWIIFGKHNLFILHYVAKVPEPPPDTITKWIKTFEEATVASEAESVGSLDVDNVIPFEMDKVMAALKPAMKSADCNVKEATANRGECSVRAIIPATTTMAVKRNCGVGNNGGKTRVQITTGKGFYGRLGKKDRSIPIDQLMIKSLEKTQK